MTEPPLLRLEGITKTYGAITAVCEVSADIRRGELVSFVGPSGCGKTTLLRVVGGFARPDAGLVALDGEDITSLPPNQRATAMVFQNYALFPHLTVAENVGYGLTIRRRPAAEVARRVEELLSLVQLQGFGRRRPAQLSGGQQQRVALARSLSSAAQGPPLGRAAVQPGRQSPHPDADGDHAAAAGAQSDHRLRHARPGRGHEHLRPHHGHGSGAHPAGRVPRPRSTSGPAAASWLVSWVPRTSWTERWETACRDRPVLRRGWAP